MLTLHPQSAMEHLHARFVAAGGSGSTARSPSRPTEVAPTTPGPHARAGPAGRTARRCPGSFADPARRQRAGGLDGGHRRGRERQERRRRHAGARRRPGPGVPAPAQAGLSTGDPARIPARDPATGRRGVPRPGGRRRWSGPGGLGLRRCRPAGGDQLGQRRSGGARRRPGATRPGVRTGDRPHRGRSRPGAGAAHRGVRGARRPRRRPGSARRSSPRCAGRSWPAWIACTASCRCRAPTCSRSRPRRAPSRSSCARSCAGRTMPRTSSTRRPSRSTASTSSG